MIPRRKSVSDDADILRRVVYTTKKGKEVKINQSKLGHFFVELGSGGKLPQRLKGRYTRYEEAEGAILAHFEGK